MNGLQISIVNAEQVGGGLFSKHMEVFVVSNKGSVLKNILTICLGYSLASTALGMALNSDGGSSPLFLAFGAMFYFRAAAIDTGSLFALIMVALPFIGSFYLYQRRSVYCALVLLPMTISTLLSLPVFLLGLSDIILFVIAILAYLKSKE